MIDGGGCFREVVSELADISVGILDSMIKETAAVSAVSIIGSVVFEESFWGVVKISFSISS
jgi:hypothetical protein